ncbi:MAG: hypothetical protein E5Y89_12770 [Mesorhizobium sp.]|nr:MAG: hypothetical protein E5Y89_12770 [Mesorhizobium sp.]
MRRLLRGLLSIIGVAILAMQPSLANSPCSGRKGGISHCQGSTFVCNDGSVSASKKNCTAYLGGSSSRALGLMDSENSNMVPSGNPGDCSCRSGQYCIGPRGGHYCFTDSGAKSYLRN